MRVATLCISSESPYVGTAHKLTPPATAGGNWTESVLYKFCTQSSCPDGAQPVAGLIFDAEGALYGTARVNHDKLMGQIAKRVEDKRLLKGRMGVMRSTNRCAMAPVGDLE
jgi:hypothetical protein